ncbi:S8 family serine peptidase [Paenibacillus sp. A3M_27_13]|uniref:S8 family serine peptidase n=1 Tax=Paenibacillus sp. A3M_27_13 TaxID=2962029 RepID=UPI0020B71BCE|nr:S8 family serine peptidase [Paenibacillus sp. A3M_27_13]
MSERNCLSHLDPRLQKSIARSQASPGTENFETAEVTEKRISVIAKVKDVQTFLDLPGVFDGKRVTAAPDKKGDIVTAKVAVSALEQIQQSPVIVTMSGAQPLKLMLHDTLREIAIPPLHSPEFNGGNGVIIGIIDHGCDFVHSNFRNSDGTTRLLSLMIQKININDGQTEEVIYTTEQINAALQNPDPYRALGYDPGYGSHGTHVMDIAAGNGLAEMSPGVAPKADLIFVEPDYRDIKNGELGYLGDSFNLLNAVNYIFDKAGHSSCVINISLGTNGGPHDGTSLFEQGIDGLLMEKPNRAVVLAAGNAFDDNVHASGTVKEGSFTDLQWVILEGDTTANELELWYSGKEEFRVELLNGDNLSLFNIGLGEKADIPGFFAHPYQGK